MVSALLASFFFGFNAFVAASCLASNTTYTNPILPGFHPDPSCIFVKEWDDTFFCASSSFEAFPGIPIHASKDLQNWKLIGNVLNRPEQLPDLAFTNRSTSGIWAPAIRYHDDTFWLVTTLVFDNKTQNDSSRWDNIIFKTQDPYDQSSWSIPVHFPFQGYDTSPSWDDDGKTYMTGSHAYRVSFGIWQKTIDLETGKLGPEPWIDLWNGTGGTAPEGPHIYKKDGWYYLMIAEGGTGLTHEETMARSRNIDGPYTPYSNNPVLTNANTTQYFQTVGHADLFQDADGNWWGVALSTRSGPDYITYPMGRATVLTPVSWPEGDYPHFDPVRGTQSGPFLPVNSNIPGQGQYVDDDDHITFAPGTSLPLHFVHWRFPDPSAYVISAPGHLNTLQLSPSLLNLTGHDGIYTGGEPQTLLARRQTDTLFTFSVNLEFTPTTMNEEAGVTVFLTQDHHMELGLVLLSNNGTSTPTLRFRAKSNIPVPQDILFPLPANWTNILHMEIKASNLTHYTFSAGPAGKMSLMQTIAYAPASLVSYGFTGTLLGVYNTLNGGEHKNGTKAWVKNWKYQGQGQFLD